MADAGEVVDELAANALPVREDVDVDVELLVRRVAVREVDRRPLAIQVGVDLDGLEVAEVLREGEVVLDLVPRGCLSGRRSR